MAGTLSQFLLLALCIICPYAYSIPSPHVPAPRPFHPNHSPSPGYNPPLPPGSHDKHKSPPHPYHPPPLISNPCPPPVVENQQSLNSVHDGHHPSSFGEPIYCTNVHADKNINAHHPQLAPPNSHIPRNPPAAPHDQYPKPAATPYKSSPRTPSYRSPRTPPTGRQPNDKSSLTPPNHHVPSPFHN